MKARLVIAAACAVSFAAAGGIIPTDKLPASASFQQSVRLPDGTILPAGKFDVQIHYQGFGNAAEFWFFQGGVLKGKSPAEARGFPSTAPGGAADASTVKLQKVSPELKIEDQTAHKDQSSYKLQKADYKEQKADTPGALQPFSWGAHGFAPGATGNALQTGGSVKLSFNSSNSSAGFSATLPLAKK